MALFCGVFAMDMLNVCAVHGLLVFDAYGVCRLMLVVSDYRVVVCLYIKN